MTGLPLTRAQSGIWLAQELDPESTTYNTAAYVEIRGSVDLDRLEAAARQAIVEAECLHVRIVGERQIVEPARVSVPVLDLDEAAADKWMRADRLRPFDLAAGPLFRSALIRLGPDRVRWYHCYHHIVVDGYGTVLIVQIGRAHV